MLNDIPQRQNQPEFIDKLAASSRAYGRVKSLGAWQSGLALLAAIIGPGVGLVYPDAKAWGALFAVFVLIFDLIFLEPWIKQYQEVGAKVQELFDTALFGLSWNLHRCQAPPDPELLHRLAEEFKRKEKTDRLRDWYPTTAGEVPIEYGRLVCQRANMRWDADLRRKYSMLFIIALFLIVVAASVAALYMKWGADHIVLSLLLPLLPAAIKLLRECRKHQESATISERTRTILEAAWKRGLELSLTPEQFAEESRRLQDELFDRRKASPTVPQWLYLWLKPKFESEMRFGSEQMVKEAKTKLGIT